MAMRFSEGEEDSIVAEINITPLTDIFLVLLIIFMISSSAMLESGLNVKLPTSKSGSLAKGSDNKPVYITIAADGSLSVNEKRATDDTIVTVLKESLANSADKTVIIRGDESIVLGKAVKIMDAARNAGAEKIAVATKNAK